MADASDSKSDIRKGVGVQLPPPAPLYFAKASHNYLKSSPEYFVDRRTTSDERRRMKK